MNLKATTILIIILSLGITSCKTNIAFFNKVPKDFYTRHHHNEVKSQPREPILCLQKSKKDDSRELRNLALRKPEIHTKNVQNDLSASKHSEASFSDYSIKPIYEKMVREKIEEDDSDEVKRQRPKVLEGFGVTSMVLAILSIGVPYFLILAVIFGVVSLSRHERFPDIFYGRQFAVAGLVISGIVLLLWVLFIAILLALVV